MYRMRFMIYIFLSRLNNIKYILSLKCYVYNIVFSVYPYKLGELGDILTQVSSGESWLAVNFTAPCSVYRQCGGYD